MVKNHKNNLKSIWIQDKKITYGQRPFIVAEAGVNHNGNLDIALKLIDAAAAAGADAIKFQTFRAEQVVTQSGKMAEYQKKNLGKEESQLEMIKDLELKEDYLPKLIKRAKEKNIIMFSSPHGHIASADLLQDLNMPAFKFASGDITNLPLLEYVAKKKKPMILGTGMSNLSEIKEAISKIKKAGNNQIIILHCTTDYPLMPENVNLRAMSTLIRELDVLVGYSDHTIGSEVAIMATALGACMIEKHFTLDKTMPGPDQASSMEPSEFRNMVEQINRASIILGNPEKRLLECEKKYIMMVRKSLVAIRDINKGEKISVADITVKRPGNGLAPKYFFKIIGKKAKQNIKKDSVIGKKDI
jgi:N,N'-diacetyllegionaminate synthase